ncbi:endonuclease domain-containing protein [Pseudonocardia zijingensis]|jgi:very-short-patch-repair endonuclease
MDLTQPFRGSSAIASGLLTPGLLRGPRFRRLFPDIHVLVDTEVDFALLSRAAYLLVEGRGALGGYSAAELLGVDCAPLGAPAEIVSRHRVRPHPRLIARQDAIPPDELQVAGGLVVTSPRRTAYDIARRTSLVEAVVAVDGLANVHGFDPGDVLGVARRHRGARGSAQLPQVVELSDRRSGSPMETRIRLALRFAGLPLPVLQHRVGRYLLDLAYPAVRIAVEYNGRDHLDPDRALHDLEREAYLTAAGWSVLRFGAYIVVRRPDLVAERVRTRLDAAAREAGVPLAALSAA